MPATLKRSQRKKKPTARRRKRPAVNSVTSYAVLYVYALSFLPPLYGRSIAKTSLNTI